MTKAKKADSKKTPKVRRKVSSKSLPPRFEILCVIGMG